MIFLYEKAAEGIRILRAFGKDGIVEIPDQIEGKNVTELAAYAFSEGMDKKELESRKKTGTFCRQDGTVVLSVDEQPEMVGKNIREIFLPPHLKKIGRYAFYNCGNLMEISFYGGLSDLGAGALTGCHRVRKLFVKTDREGSSCLREFLTELPEELTAEIHNGTDTGSFCFPEFFEEGVENTPARILENHVHGSGIRYRNCFLHKVLNIREYDDIFPYAVAWEKESMVLELALGRILFPMELSAPAEERYLNYLKTHIEATVFLLIRKKEYRALGTLLKKLDPEPEMIQSILEEPEVQRDVAGVGLLMDDLRNRTGKRRKVFDL